jgi:hypothetical protein
MTAMIQIRNVPDALHRKLKARAALLGKSLSDYLLESMPTSPTSRLWRSGAEACVARADWAPSASNF